MRTYLRLVLAAVAVLTAGAAPAPAGSGPSAPAPTLAYVFSVRVTLAPPVEVGTFDVERRRFIAITGGTITGPRLQGEVMPGGGDWQSILPGGLTRLDARYFLKAADGTVIEVTNPGVRTAAPEVIERIAKGEDVDPSLYYFRTTPSFRVAGEQFAWMQRSVFVARGVRRSTSVSIDFYLVE